MGCKQGLLVVLGFVVACGGGEKAPDSTVQSGGSGGTGGAGGSLTLDFAGKAGASGAMTVGGAGSATGGVPGSSGDSAGAPQSAGEPPTITLHTCPTTPDPPCPPKAFAGNVLASKAGDLAALAGVTSIEGRLEIVNPDGLDNLSCLETVGDDVHIRIIGAPGDTSLWGLRNLRSAGGGIDLTGGFDRAFIDCAFARVESLGKAYVTGGAVDADSNTAGELDLSSLQEVRHIRVNNSELTRVKLPNDRMLSMGQLWFDDNKYLSEVSGFMGVTVKAGESAGNSVRIIANPRLSQCRAQELANIFIAGGAIASSVTVKDNLPCAM